MKAMDWKDQYKHPNWQRKRQEALVAAEYTCQHCFDTETSLHVHHKRYVKGRKVWEYDTSELVVLCESCHEAAHEDKETLNQVLIRVSPGGDLGFVPFLASYLEHKSGPCCIRDEQFTQQFYQESPYQYVLGKLAASLEQRMTMDALVSLCAFLDDGDDGDTFTLSIPVRKPFKGGEF